MQDNSNNNLSWGTVAVGVFAANFLTALVALLVLKCKFQVDL